MVKAGVCKTPIAGPIPAVASADLLAFEHYVYGYGSGASNCGYYWYLRATFRGFQLQVQCSSPLITLVDNPY